MEESISIEETNKIRVSLGLKPLVGDSDGPTKNSEKLAEANYANQRAAERKQRESKQIVERIAKVRNRKELNAKLKGVTLGEAGESEDTLQWINRTKLEKGERELAKGMQEGNETLLDSVAHDEYTERDLVDVKVSHNFDEMDAGDATILTLKDKI